MKINKFIRKKSILSLLNEQSDSEKEAEDFFDSDVFKTSQRSKDVVDLQSKGFKPVESNKDALQMKDPQSKYMQQLLKNTGITAKIGSTYYIYEPHYKVMVKTDRLGKTGKELGISGDGDPYTYKKIGEDRYLVISGPAPASIGKKFNKKSNKKTEAEPAEEKKKSNDNTSKKLPTGKKLSKNEFVSAYADTFIDAQKGTGIYPSFSMAQMALETYWAKKTVSGEANNLFGIKAKGKKTKYWQGDYVEAETEEVIDGQRIKIISKFRKYANPMQSINDHNEFLKGPRYKKVVEAETPEEQAVEVKKAGYATAEEYISSLQNIIKSIKKIRPDIDDAMKKEKGIQEKPQLAEGTNKMIITEDKLRNIIKKILLENKTTDIKFIQKTIGAKDDGIWGDKTDEKWVAWVDKNIDALIKASGGGIKKDTALKFKENAAQLASLVLNDPSKKSISGVAEMVKLVQDPEAIKNKQATEKKAKNLSTGGKLVALKGSNPDGTYPALPDKGIDGPYYKFILDTQAFAFDPNNKEEPLKQRSRGTGGDYLVNSEGALFERVLGIKLVKEFISPGLVLGKIKDGEVSDPKGVFKDNKEKIQTTAKSIYDKKFSNKAKILDPSEYEIQKSEDGAPNVPAVRKFVAAAKEEIGMVFNSLGRSAADQARISFQGPYANDALIRKIDPSIPPGTYYFSNHPKSKENLEKINAALKKLGKSSVSKGVYSAYGSSTYMPIFKNYEKALKDVQKVGATGKSALGDTGKSAWEATIPFWEKIAKSQKAKGKKGHMTGYGIDIPRNTSKERLIQLNDIANRFGLYINTNTKPESDHFHLNIYELSPSDLEKLNNKKEKGNVSESKNKRRRLRRRR